MAKHTELYDIFGLSPDATDEEIKKAYRKMALKYHPDKNSGDPEAAKKFMEIKEAFDILSDPRKRSLYDSMGKDAVTMMDNPSTFTAEKFMSVIRSSSASSRCSIFLFVLIVVLGALWFVLTLSFRIDSWIHWPWWVVMIPAFIVDAFKLLLYLLSIPVLFKKSRQNKELESDEQLPLLPRILDIFNGILFIVAQVCFVLRLDNIWDVTYATSLIPFYIWSLQNIYMPCVLRCYHLATEDPNAYSFNKVVFALTVYFVAAKVDGTLNWSWGLTFLPIWVWFAWLIFSPLCMAYCLSGSAAVAGGLGCISICAIIPSVIVAVLVLLKISGKWRWAVSALVIPSVIVGFCIVLPLLLQVYAALFRNTGVEEEVHVESTYKPPQSKYEATVEMGID